MIISVILVSYNTQQLTKQVLDTLLKSNCANDLQIIIIDNASKDDSVKMLKTEFPQLQLIENKTNVGFGRANNQALPYIKGDYVLLLNTDAFVEFDTIEKTVSFMQAHPKVGILGAKLVGRDGVLQHSCRYFPTMTNLFLWRTNLAKLFKNVQLVDDMSWDHSSVRYCDWVPGCYYLMQKKMIDQIGMFDPLYFLYYEEVDHCLSAKKAGWEVVYYPNTTVIHIGGESAKSEGAISNVSRQLVSLQIESELLYFRKNHGLLTMLVHLVLNTMLDFLEMIKNILTLKKLARHAPVLQHINLSWKLCVKTKFGTVATR